MPCASGDEKYNQRRVSQNSHYTDNLLVSYDFQHFCTNHLKQKVISQEPEEADYVVELQSKGRKKEEKRKSSQLVDSRGSQKPPSLLSNVPPLPLYGQANSKRLRNREKQARRRRDRRKGRVIRRAETGNVLRNLQQSLDETIGHPRRNTGYAGSNNSSACCLLSLPPLSLF